jgi:hypothetical protein
VHTDEHKPGMVVSEVAKGYAVGERVLRAAKVVVAKEPDRGQKSEVRGQKAEGAEGKESRISEDEAGESGGASNG